MPPVFQTSHSSNLFLVIFFAPFALFAALLKI